MGGKKKGGQGQQQQGDAGGSGGPPRQQQGGPGPGQGGPGPRGHQQGGPSQGGPDPRGYQPRGPSPQGYRPRGPGPQGHQQQGPGPQQYRPRGPGPQSHQPRQGGQWQPRGPRGPSPQGGPDQRGYSGPHGGSSRPPPGFMEGPPPGQYPPPADQGFQQPQSSQVFASEFPAPVWGKRPEPAPEAQPVQQAAPAQPPSAAPGEAKPKGKGKGRGKIFEKTDPTPPPPFAAPASSTAEKSQPTPAEAKPSEPSPTEVKQEPTPAEAKPGGKKKKGKGQEQKPTPAATPSPASSEVGDVAKKMEKVTLQTFNLPKRKVKEVVHQGPHVMKRLFIEVNYLPLKIKDPKLKIYHYDVHLNPDKPKYLLRKAVEEIRKKHFPNRHPAFDGMKNLYVAGNPLNNNNAVIRDTVHVHNHETGKDKEFDVTIKMANDDLNISKIFDYCNKGVTSNIPQTEIQATDIALRSGLTNLFTPAGRSFFARPTRERPVVLGGGMELWHGFYQSAIAAWKPYLNIDVANKAFPIEQKVIDYMCEEFRCNYDAFYRGLDSDQKYRLEKFIKGLKISYDMPSPDKKQIQKRIYKVSGIGGTPIEETFKPKDDGPKISVGQYYQKEKKYDIQFPRLPLLKIGTKGSMVPIELCSIIGDQAVMRKLDEYQTSQMVRAAARPTTERKQRIDENIRRANYMNNPTLKEFGIEVQTSFERVEAVVIKPPDIKYNRNITGVRDGVWRLERDYFLTAATIPPWAVLNLDYRARNIESLERLMVSVGTGLGMTVPRPQQSVSPNIRGRLQERDMDKFLMDFGRNGVKLVIVILSNSPDIYGQVKRASELRTGVLTQCIKSRTVERINPMTVTNILLKVNAKLTGTNHCLAPDFKPEIMRKPCMLVGADVTHPAPGSGAEFTPSIAAVAASQDAHGFQYKMLYRLQRSREEMIVELADMMKEQLLTFFRRWKCMPEKIIYFRDGVSEGQFQQVLNAELLGIRKACSMIDPAYQPAITFLVVQKRHHTRFFPNPKDGDRKNCNVPAGTLVDKQITHPTEVDFYLVSHQSIQGTARPTKYHLLWDDSDIPQIELEKLTYYLCHMFSRCTRSVSYPAPTYYAHLAAFRARAWWDSQSPNMAQLRQEQEGRGKICSQILDNYPMFFT